MWVELSRNFVFFGGIFLYLQALGQATLPKPSKIHRLYMWLYFCLGSVELGAWNVNADLRFVLPWLSYFDMVQFYSVGPLIYLMYKELVAKNNEGVKRWYVHFIVPAMAGISTIPYYLMSAEEKANRLQLWFSAGKFGMIHETVYAFGGVYTTMYILYAFKDFAGLWRPDILRNEKPAQVIVLVLLMAILVSFWGGMGLLYQEFAFIRVGSLTIAVSAAIIFLIGYRYPHFNQSLQLAVSQSKYKKSYIKDLNLKDLQSKLDDLMTKKKVFRDEELNLGALSSELGISVHQLSQFLNEKLGKNFSVFINEFRIREAQELMRSEPEMNILRIAYEVGFNSKTSFNRYFHRFVGESPIKYRTKIMKDKA